MSSLTTIHISEAMAPQILQQQQPIQQQQQQQQQKSPSKQKQADRSRRNKPPPSANSSNTKGENADATSAETTSDCVKSAEQQASQPKTLAKTSANTTTNNNSNNQQQSKTVQSKINSSNSNSQQRQSQRQQQQKPPTVEKQQQQAEQQPQQLDYRPMRHAQSDSNMNDSESRPPGRRQSMGSQRTWQQELLLQQLSQNQSPKQQRTRGSSGKSNNNNNNNGNANENNGSSSSSSNVNNSSGNNISNSGNNLPASNVATSCSLSSIASAASTSLSALSSAISLEAALQDASASASASTSFSSNQQQQNQQTPKKSRKQNQRTNSSANNSNGNVENSNSSKNNSAIKVTSNGDLKKGSEPQMTVATPSKERNASANSSLNNSGNISPPTSGSQVPTVAIQVPASSKGKQRRSSAGPSSSAHQYSRSLPNESMLSPTRHGGNGNFFTGIQGLNGNNNIPSYRRSPEIHPTSDYNNTNFSRTSSAGRKLFPATPNSSYSSNSNIGTSNSNSGLSSLMATSPTSRPISDQRYAGPAYHRAPDASELPPPSFDFGEDNINEEDEQVSTSGTSILPAHTSNHLSASNKSISNSNGNNYNNSASNSRISSPILPPNHQSGSADIFKMDDLNSSINSNNNSINNNSNTMQSSSYYPAGPSFPLSVADFGHSANGIFSAMNNNIKPISLADMHQQHHSVPPSLSHISAGLAPNMLFQPFPVYPMIHPQQPAPPIIHHQPMYPNRAFYATMHSNIGPVHQAIPPAANSSTSQMSPATTTQNATV